jgi:4-amino-4-deoxy-L-arabinose transferase-like glycosyltransferase
MTSRASILWLMVVYAIVAGIRIAAPSDLGTGDQPLQLAYITDITINGHWAMQFLEDGTPAAKPPLYNWLAAVPVAIAGENPRDIDFKFPSLAAGLAALILTWSIARTLAGERAALVAGLLFTASTMFSKHVYFARTDMLLTALVVLQAYAALQTRPLLYWTAAALALLTKGPIGLLIPALSCSVYWWARGEFRERWKQMRWAIGLPASLAVFAAWFAAAIASGGAAVFDQLVFAETLDRFSAHSSKSKENRHILYYIPHFLARMAPASLFSALALPRVRRSAHPLAFAGYWLMVTFVFVSLIPSKRADRLFPLFPAACILAGWVIDRFDSDERVRGTAAVLAFATIVFCAAGIALPPGPAIAVFAAGIALAFATRRRDPLFIAGCLTIAMLLIIAAYQFGVVDFHPSL